MGPSKCAAQRNNDLCKITAVKTGSLIQLFNGSKTTVTVDLSAMWYNLNLVQKHRRSLKLCYRNPQNMLTDLVQILTFC